MLKILKGIGWLMGGFLVFVFILDVLFPLEAEADYHTPESEGYIYEKNEEELTERQRLEQWVEENSLDGFESRVQQFIRVGESYQALIVKEHTMTRAIWIDSDLERRYMNFIDSLAEEDFNVDTVTVNTFARNLELPISSLISGTFTRSKQDENMFEVYNMSFYPAWHYLINGDETAFQ